MRTSLTFLVPTLNRAGYLRHCLATCVAQTDPDFVVIVSNNQSDDNTRQVVAELADSRIRYIEPPQRLSMTDHWEFAIGHVETDYLTFLGDDDGLLPYAVALARHLLQEEPDALAWRKVEYCWPDHILDEYRNYIAIPLTNETVVYQSMATLKGVVNFRRAYNVAPCLYNSLVHRRVVDRVRCSSSRQRYFDASSPDVFSSIANAAYSKRFLYCSRPLTVNGASAASNGTRYTTGAHDGDTAAFRATSPLHQPLDFDGLVTTAIADAILTAIDTLPEVKRLCRFDARRYASACFNEIQNSSSAWQRRDVIIPIVRRSAVGFGEERHFDKLNATLQPSTTSGPRRGVDPAGESLVLFGNDWGIGNVADAASFVAKLLGTPALNTENSDARLDVFRRLQKAARVLVRGR